MEMVEYERFCIWAYNVPRRGVMWAWAPRKGTMADGRAYYATGFKTHGGFKTHDAAYKNALTTTEREDK